MGISHNDAIRSQHACYNNDSIFVFSRHVAELAPPHSHFVPMILSSDIRKHFTGIECDQLRRLENKNNDNMSFGTTLDDLTTVASSYPSTRGKYFITVIT